jgi:cytochrome c-type biogenesis protein
MVEAPVGLALAAGMLAVVNPCGFALLPAYLGLLVHGSAGQASAPAAAARALAAAGAMTLGFAAVFGAFGLVISPVAGQVQRHLPWFTIGLGLLVLAVGVLLLAGRPVPVPGVRLRAGPVVRRSVPSMALFGAAYAIASLGCTIGPFLATVAVTFRAGTLVSGVATFLAYAAGMGLAVGATALAVALSHDAVPRRLRRWGPWPTRLGGALLAAAGAYVAYYGWYEVRVLRGGGADDPVVSAAETVQRWLASGLGALGVGGLAVLAGLLLAGVPLLAAVGRARRTGASGRVETAAGAGSPLGAPAVRTETSDTAAVNREA